MHKNFKSVTNGIKPYCIPLAILLAISLATYLPSLQHQFLSNWDDMRYVVNNDDAHGLSTEHIKAAFSRFYVANYAPLQIISYMFDYQIWGLKPFGFIATNILLHLVNGALFFKILITKSFRRIEAFVAVFIFLLHPVQVESVVWISQRKNLLAMTFFLLSFIYYIKHSEAENSSKSTTNYLVSLSLFCCAMLTKAVAIILPLALILYDYSYGVHLKTFIERVKNKIPYILIATVIAVITIFAQQTNSDDHGGITGYHGGSPLNTLLTMLPVSMLYMKNLFFPVQLSSVYHPDIKTAIDAEIMVAAVLVISLISAGVWLLLRRKEMFFWYMFFFIAFIPVAQIVPLITLMNDRYLYFPMIGFAALLGRYATTGTSDTIPTEKRLLFTLIPACCILLLPYLSYQRSKIWQNSISLWTDAYIKSPGSDTLFGLADAYYGNGEREKGEKLFKEVLKKDPTHKFSLLNLAVSKIQLGDFTAARHYLLKLVKIYPDFPTAFNQLGNTDYMTGNYKNAEKNYLKAIELKPDYANPLAALGNIKLAEKDFDAAKAYLSKALSKDNKNPQIYYSIACLYSMQGKADESLSNLEEALKLGLNNLEQLLGNHELDYLRTKKEFKLLLIKYGQTTR